MYRVYLFNKGDQHYINTIEADDILSRQTIIKKDGNSYGYEGKTVLILEGSGDIFTRLEQLSEGHAQVRGDNTGREIYDRIKKENEDAQGGVGFLFG
jgi:hypothetical protein